jgi:DNA polymerase III epsilon subunit-like protein
MGYIAWDTETSGKPPQNVDTVTPENYQLWNGCRMASIASIQFSRHGREIDSQHTIVYPNGFVLGTHQYDPVGATEVHGITQSHAKRYGVPFVQVYERFLDFIRKARVTTLVAHNANFDKNVLFAECYRYGLSVEPFQHLNFVCTLDMAKSAFLDTPNNRCETLFNYITGETFRAHDALEDSRACGVIYSVVRDIKFRCNPIGIDTIVINVSDVPTITGATWFKKPIDVAKTIVGKYYDQTDRGICRREFVERMRNENDAVNTIVSDALRFQSKRMKDIESKLSAVSVQLGLKTNLNNAHKMSICEYVGDVIRGRIATVTYDKKYYTLEVCVIRGTKYILTGYADKLIRGSSGNLVVVDVTDRTDSRFKGLTEVDKVRCQVLMNMLNVDECRFEEQREDAIHTESLTRDARMWKETILPKLERFCEYVHSRLGK